MREHASLKATQLHIIIFNYAASGTKYSETLFSLLNNFCLCQIYLKSLVTCQSAYSKDFFIQEHEVDFYSTLGTAMFLGF
jgi:hypothetical protein